jgi:predicted ABC-type ATPase
MRMFAGPNGSGKSVLKSCLPEPLLGVYLNPDEIEAEIKRHGYLDMRCFDIETNLLELKQAFSRSALLTQQGMAGAAEALQFTEGRLYFPQEAMNSYLASVLVDHRRTNP